MSEDERLRKLGFRIFARPKTGEAVWVRVVGKRLMRFTQSEARHIADRQEKIHVRD
jgi:hypothetical protein